MDKREPPYENNPSKNTADARRVTLPVVIIIDYNKLQALTFVKDTLNIEPLREKFISFGCEVKIINGHNFNQIKKAFKSKCVKKPTVIIANTIKGKGVSFMENNNDWHYKSPNKSELENSINEVNDA